MRIGYKILEKYPNLEECKLKKSREIFIEQYIYYVLEMRKATFKGHYRTNNKYAKKIYKLKTQYENEEYFGEALSAMIDNDNLEIAMNAASDSLRKNVNIDKAIKKLEEISSKKDIENKANFNVNFSAYRAEIVLDIWREKGIEGLK